MNFFTKVISPSDLDNHFCSAYVKGLYNPEGAQGNLLDLLKLNYINKPSVYLNPIDLIEAMFLYEGWLEGWALIKDEVEVFLKNNGPTKDLEVVDLSTIPKRKEILRVLHKDTKFMSVDLRLEIIRIIESKS